RRPGRAVRPRVRLHPGPPPGGQRLMRRALLLALVVALVPGCGRLTPSGRGTSATGPLRVWIMEPGSPDLRTFLTGATGDFEAAHPGDRVQIQFVPWASAHDQFVTAIGGGQVPDVAEMGSTSAPATSRAWSTAPPSTARSTASPGTPAPGPSSTAATSWPPSASRSRPRG